MAKEQRLLLEGVICGKAPALALRTLSEHYFGRSIVDKILRPPSPAGIVGSMDDFFMQTRRHGIPRAAFKTISAGDGGQYERRQ